MLIVNSEVPVERLGRDTFNFAAAVLPLADKYGMPKMIKFFLPRVEADWPQTLARWDLNEDHIRESIGYFNCLRTANEDHRFGDDMIPEPCSAIRLGRTFPLPDILPAAFYHLSRLPPIFEKKSDLYLEHVIKGKRTADWQLLLVDDYQTLLGGKSEIRAWVKGIATYMGESRWKSISHASRDDCEGHSWWTQRMKWLLLEQLAEEEVDPLRLFSELSRRFSEERWSGKAIFKLCGACFSELEVLLREYRQELWWTLPQFFDLEVEVL